MAGPNGGKRPGAGRKKKSEKFAGAVAKAEERIAKGDRLPRVIDNLLHLADGGYERVIQRFEPAGTYMAELPVRDENGNPTFDAAGQPIVRKQLVFPDKPADEMVCVQRTVEFAEPDRAANIYLADRIMGKPKQALEHQGPEGEPIQVQFYIPSNGRDQGVPTPGGAAGDVAQ